MMEQGRIQVLWVLGAGEETSPGLRSLIWRRCLWFVPIEIAAFRSYSPAIQPGPAENAFEPAPPTGAYRVSIRSGEKAPPPCSG